MTIGYACAATVAALIKVTTLILIALYPGHCWNMRRTAAWARQSWIPVPPEKARTVGAGCDPLSDCKAEFTLAEIPIVSLV